MLFIGVPVQTLILPFMPRQKLEPLLRRLSAAVDSYCSSSVGNVIASLEEAVRAAQNLIAESDALETSYSRRYLGEPLRALVHELQADFEKSPFKRETSFRLAPSDKKYPFHTDGATVNLEIELESLGPGFAFDVKLDVMSLSEGIPTSDSFQLGEMPPSRRLIQIEVVLDRAVEEVLLEVRLGWLTFERQEQNLSTIIEFHAQKGDIDWKLLSTLEPYDLEPITSESNLVGRSETLNQLTGMTTGSAIGSAIIHGQKRVGKTSIVKALQSKLASEGRNIITVYLEAGEYVRPDPVRTIQALGNRLSSEIISVLPDLKPFVPTFEDALSPLSTLLADMCRSGSHRLLMILDEFDELPTELYTHNETANAFFLALRSISAKAQAGFILVGSERMPAILNFQGQNLNKFRSIRVDYFNRQEHWNDYVDLVRRPVQGQLEFSDRAVNVLYEYTAGNPYFTKLLCKSVFHKMVRRRDAHVTESEVLEACVAELKDVDTNSFVHFWEDGIVEQGDERERVSLLRRKVLLAFGEVLRRSSYRVPADKVVAAAKAYDVSAEAVHQLLDEFTQRQVFERHASNLYEIKVKFFADWLKDAGVGQLLSRLTDRIVSIERRTAEVAYVRAEEILGVTKKWGQYKGRDVGSEQIRAWLNQFGPAPAQRLMFKVINSLRFYTETEIRSRLRDLHALVDEGLVPRFRHGSGRRSEIVVSYFEGPGKSGFQYARLYAEENNIAARNVCEPSKVLPTLLEAGAKAVLWVDDFIGTGDTVIARFREHREIAAELQRRHQAVLFFGAISGLSDSCAHVHDELQRMGIDVAVRVCDPVTREDLCFSPNSNVFLDEDERARAKRIAEDFGRRLVSSQPLGYGGCGTTIVFARSCPNNNLPILWSSTKDWISLFPR